MSEDKKEQIAEALSRLCYREANDEETCPMRGGIDCPFPEKLCISITPDDWMNWMDEDEKRGFQNGFRVMLKMVEEGGYLFLKSGRKDLANAFFGFIGRAERDVERITELYAKHGHEAIMQALKKREGEEK